LKKTIKERKHEEKLKKKEEDGVGSAVSHSSDGGGGGGLDMMSELKRRLESRRSGISSEKAPAKSGPVTGSSSELTSPTSVFSPSSAMANVSALIPPPPASDLDDDDDDEDEDWE